MGRKDREHNQLERRELDVERKELHEDKRIVELLERVVELNQKTVHELRVLNDFVRAAKSLDLTQEGETMGVITGIAPGATETFDLSPLPAGSSLQAGSIPTYTQDNTSDVSALTASADGLSFSITGGAAFATGAVLNVTANAVSSSGAALSKVFNIPLLAPAATDLDLNQRAK